MLGLEKIADKWDEDKRKTEKVLDRFVDQHPDWFGVVVATATSTAMEVGGGFVDVLRIGEGVKEGGWGYAKDALRVVSLAGPVAKVGKFGAQLTRSGLARVTTDPGGPLCAWVASTKALRQTGTRHFAKVTDLIKAAKHSAAPKSMAEMISVLKKMGASGKHLGKPQSMKQLEQLTSQYRDGVILFGVSWSKGGHALYAFRNAAGKFRIADRTGKIVGNLSELDHVYQGIGTALPQGAAVFVRNARIISNQAVTNTSLAGILAVEVRAVMLVDESTAKSEAERIQTGRVGGKVGGNAGQSHTVSRGESLSLIAKKYYGNAGAWKRIYEANRSTIGSNPNFIRPGMKLTIPKK